MSADVRLLNDRFPRSAKYHPQWLIANGMSGAGCTLWLTEWLAETLDLQPGLRVLDLGCGKAISSIFLAREFGVQVWAADLWIAASDNARRIADSGLSDRVFPLHCDARSLPFAGEFFDAVVCIDCYSYFGTDDLYLNYLANFVRIGGQLGIAGAGLLHELDDGVPAHLQAGWTQDFWSLHSAAWWRRLWERTGLVEIEVSDTLPDGWKHWLQWQQEAWPDNRSEIDAVQADAGQTLGIIRQVARRRNNAPLADYCWPDPLRTMPLPAPYEQQPLLRSEKGS
jgi:SAM-dependent methyltransferase